MTTLRSKAPFGLALLSLAIGVMAQDGGASSVEKLNRNLVGPNVRQAPAKDAVKAPAATAPVAPAKPGGYAFKVSGFQFNGATVFELEELLSASGAKLFQTYDLAGLQAIADAITAHYRQSGYMVARAWLAPQAIKDETVVFQIYEGHLSKSEPIRVSAKSTEVDKTRISKIAQQSLCQEADCASKPLTQARVDRAALLVTEITGYQVKAELVPGKELGSTTMVLAASPRLGSAPGLDEATVGALTAQRHGYAVEVSVDNFGSKATGVNRGQARLAVNDMLQEGDQVGVSYMTTNKSDINNYSVDYSVAVGYDGWRVGASASKTQFTLASGYGGFAGDANTGNVYASYPIIRSNEKNVDFRLDYDHIKLSDESASPGNRRINAARVGLSGDLQDRDVANLAASTTWGVGVSESNLKYDDGRAAAVSPAVGSRSKYTGRISRLQGIDGTGWYLGANVDGQRATGNLDSYGKLFLGGANAVRAYAGGEVGGDTAIVGQFAMGKSWPVNYAGQSMQTDLSAFYDRGWARLQQNPTAGTTGNEVSRAGWGLEAKVSEKDKYALRAFWAKGRSGLSTIDNKQSRVGLSLGIAF